MYFGAVSQRIASLVVEQLYFCFILYFFVCFAKSIAPMQSLA